MNIDLIPVGDSPPDSLNVVIEVPVGGEPVKYEFDKKSGALFVDRILHTPMRYPANYGFVPLTMSPDGDPLDALVVARSPFIPGSVVRTRPRPSRPPPPLPPPAGGEGPAPSPSSSSRTRPGATRSCSPSRSTRPFLI